MAPLSTATEAGATKKASGKKKRKKSKHVMKATEEQKNNPNGESNSLEKTKPKIKIISRKKLKHKDPSEAASYLENWKKKQDGNGDSGWKFNKNTQSWLIRHQYETDKVSKSTFALLIEYCKGLQGDTIKARMLSDAKRRILRYKSYEKSKETTTREDENDGGDVASRTEIVAQTDDDDEKRWSKLDDHSKRKEYKRARQIMEMLKQLDPPT